MSDDPLTVERSEKGVRLTHEPDAKGGDVIVGKGKQAVLIEAADLYWLVTAGGPAMIALLGGPIDGRGIERVDTPPPPPEEKPRA